MTKRQRRQKRVDITIDVGLAHESKLQKLYSRNLSRGGIFLFADELLPVASRVTLEFYISELERKFVVDAEVVHHHTYETFEDETTVKREQGMGFRFIDLSIGEEEIIENYILGKELKKGD